MRCPLLKPVTSTTARRCSKALAVPACWRWPKTTLAAPIALYTVKFVEAVFVLHCFQKKSKRGIATPKEDMDIIRAQLKVAEARTKELRNGKTNH